MVDGRCMKCQSKQTMKDPTQSKMSNGRPYIKGLCSVCGTKMSKIGSLE